MVARFLPLKLRRESSELTVTPVDNDPKKITSIDVALSAGVSQSTVSRAFDPTSRVSNETRDLVIETARRLNYVPNSIARSLITQKSNLVAIVLGDMRNSFYTSALDDFVHRFQEVGYSVVVLSVPRASEADSVVRKVLPYQVDGIVITASSISAEMSITCRDRRIPVVIFNRHIPGVHAHTVCCDNVDGGRMAAEGLIRSGARTFGIIYGEQGAVNSDRISGFKEVLGQAGFETDAVPAICGYTTFTGGYQAAIRLLSSPSRPEAIFCTNDVMAFGAIDAARYGMNMRVPEDLRIMGFDGIKDSERPSYSLSTIEQPVMQMIEETVNIITSGGRDRLSSSAHFLKGSLIRRDSTRDPNEGAAQTRAKAELHGRPGRGA